MNKYKCFKGSVCNIYIYKYIYIYIYIIQYCSRSYSGPRGQFSKYELVHNNIYYSC